MLAEAPETAPGQVPPTGCRMLWLSVQFPVCPQGKGTYSDTVDILEFYVAELDDPIFLNVIRAQLQGLGEFASFRFLKIHRAREVDEDFDVFWPLPWGKREGCDSICALHSTGNFRVPCHYEIVCEQCKLSYYKKVRCIFQWLSP